MTSLGVKWKLYSGISSSEVRNLHAPYVSMTLTTTSKVSSGEGKGQPETRVLEMRVDQFKSLMSTLEEIQAQMEVAKLT